ncbi:Signal transduction histidine kinase [Micromonospora citrea]|uniref:histidine kinase n=2 Tax=Micromonospora citrea TaxID=47855 RepID=A0A1C6UE20_9ACTN|nr:Signal transduction histidine kinase [Micromonospora citrea]
MVAVVDTLLLAAAHSDGLPPAAIAAYALTVVLVIALRYRSPAASFVAALALATLTGGTYVLLLWAAYQAGRAISSPTGTAVTVGAAVGGLGAQLVARGAQGLAPVVSTFVVFVALPLLVGRYLAQHDRLVSALDRNNRQLRREQEILAERERLDERLRIARDMHDSLGHRLSLVSVQAAALEVAELPPQQQQAVRQLATATRRAMVELYELVGALRERDEAPAASTGVPAIGWLVAEFQAAGVSVTLRERGQALPLSTAAGQAAYRVVEEGLTNAVKHAPGQPVTVDVGWEDGTLLLTVVNPLPDPPTPRNDIGSGHGLTGLSERLLPAGGFLDHRLTEGSFRLYAMLPCVRSGVAEQPADDDHPLTVGRFRTVAVGFAAAVLMFVVLPASILAGVG